MKITHISDTHNKHKQLNGKLPGGDILIHSGDISSLGRQREVEGFVKWFNAIDNYTYKIFIAGNHDMSFESEKLMQTKIDYFDGKNSVWVTEGLTHQPDNGKPYWLSELLEVGLAGGVFYLENESIEIEGIKIWGSPLSAAFGLGWAFNVQRGYDSADAWNQIPTDTDIVITHGPIYGYGDVSQNSYENVGCQELYHRLKELKTPLHFSGHIHEGYGYYQTKWDGYAFNGSTCNLRYEAINKPITFDYDFGTKQLEFLM